MHLEKIQKSDVLERLGLEKDKYILLSAHPVSYTHLDVYKRQEDACRNRAKRFNQNACYDAYAALYEEEVKNAGK